MIPIPTNVPAIRIHDANSAPINADGQFVLYWMIAARRTTYNFALQRAAALAAELRRPLVVLEALRHGYRWASDRLHQFVLDGIRDNAARLKSLPVLYYPFVETKDRPGQGLVEALAARSCCVVTDDFPCFFLPRMVAATATRLSVRLECVDSNGLLPLRVADSAFPTAHVFRRFLQENLPAHLGATPKTDALRGAKLSPLAALPAEITRRWPAADAKLLAGEAAVLATLPIDHAVAVAPIAGGPVAAQRVLARFLRRLLSDYPQQRNEPDADGTSGLSPYLHFGHVSAHQVFAAIADREDWTPTQLGARARGKRSGWWGMSEPAEAFLDQLVTWREVGFNFCSQREDYDRFESLPDWAQKTLTRHATDPRANEYSLEEFETSRTHDRLWNAAQAQLVREGRMHNYLRMLWGKKILQWTSTPRDALAVMIELNNKYALDGRDPNSYSGIFWVLGRFDRPWGPERPIFGTVRYMTSENTARKYSVKDYIARYTTGGTSKG
jgi:deoxyribodipyrimidine photo-lyase